MNTAISALIVLGVVLVVPITSLGFVLPKLLVFSVAASLSVGYLWNRKHPYGSGMVTHKKHTAWIPWI